MYKVYVPVLLYKKLEKYEFQAHVEIEMTISKNISLNMIE